MKYESPGVPFYDVCQSEENNMAFYGDPKETLRASQMCKTWEANRTKLEAQQAEEQLSKSVVEFSNFITKLVISKKGALPDVRDWKEIKKHLDNLVTIENQAKSKQERYVKVESQLAEINELLCEDVDSMWSNTWNSNNWNEYQNSFNERLREAYQPVRLSEQLNKPLPALHSTESELKFQFGGASAFEFDKSTGHVRGYDERMIRNGYANIK